MENFRLFMFAMLGSFMLKGCHSGPTHSVKMKSAASLPGGMQSQDAFHNDSVFSLLRNQQYVPAKWIIGLGVLDSAYRLNVDADATVDTTIELNHGIYYSILHLPDEAGVCSYYFLVSFGGLRNKAIMSAFLVPDCDIDFSATYYPMYEWKLMAKYSLLVTRKGHYQKENQQTGEMEEIPEAQEREEEIYFKVMPNGEIHTQCK